MPALEPLRGLRVVADPAALDGAAGPAPDRTDEPIVVCGSRPTRRFALGATARRRSTTRTPSSRPSPASSAPADQPTSIAVGAHIEWAPPDRRPALAQGKIAGVPAKLWLADDGACLRRHDRAYADELRDGSDGAIRREHMRRHAPADPLAGPRRSRRTTSSSSAAAGTASSTAYYLATRHGITNVAVLEADYIASGNTGRNTTIIRANYGIPEAIRFYQHSPGAVPAPRGRDRRRDLSTRPRASSGCAHTEMAMRTERARAALMNQALRRRDRHGHAGRGQGADPPDRPDRRRPLPGPRRVAPRRRPRPLATTGSPGRTRPARRSAASTSSSTAR